MLHHVTKAAVAAVALAGFGLLAPAHAVSPLPLNEVASPVIPVIDEETAVEELERPNEVEPGSQDKGEKGETEQPQEDNPAGEEVQELQRAFPSTEWPPTMKNEE